VPARAADSSEKVAVPPRLRYPTHTVHASNCRRRISRCTPTADITAATGSDVEASFLGDGGRRVLEAGGDLVSGQLDDGALVALLRLVRALLEAAGDDDPGAAGEGLGEVLRGLAPDAAAQEQRIAVLPLRALGVVPAGGGRDGERRDRPPRWG